MGLRFQFEGIQAILQLPLFPSSSLSVFNTRAVPLSFSSSAHLSPFIGSI